MDTFDFISHQLQVEFVTLHKVLRKFVLIRYELVTLQYWAVCKSYILNEFLDVKMDSFRWLGLEFEIEIVDHEFFINKVIRYLS